MTRATPDFHAVHALVGSLYDSADLSHDQANPIIEALEAAIILRDDRDNLLSALERLLDSQRGLDLAAWQQAVADARTAIAEARGER